LIDVAYSEKTGHSGFIHSPIKENAMSVNPIPEGYQSITPYLGIDKAAEAIEFYKKAFNATQIMRLDMPDGRVGHAELRMGGSAIMLGSPCDEAALRNPGEHASVGLHLYVQNVDEQFKQAVTAGAKVVSEPQDQFYGDRSATVKDPYGHLWFLATRKEDLTPEQIHQRAEELFRQG
jgi:PhnB protein